MEIEVTHHFPKQSVNTLINCLFPHRWWSADTLGGNHSNWNLCPIRGINQRNCLVGTGCKYLPLYMCVCVCAVGWKMCVCVCSFTGKCDR